jgi:hypothetical protein
MQERMRGRAEPGSWEKPRVGVGLGSALSRGEEGTERRGLGGTEPRPKEDKRGGGEVNLTMAARHRSRAGLG